MKTIRIFISSTFRDMHSERDYLVKYVFPELRERCMKKGLYLVDVDLRWGVTQQDAEQGKALELCLDEIENCRPFFIGLLGERYGWIPENYQMPDYPKFDWLKKFEKGHSITALEIYHGVLRNPDMHTSAFFYFRSPAFQSEVPTEKQIDITAENEDSAYKLQKLKKEIRKVYRELNILCPITESYSCNYKGLKINLAQLKDEPNSTVNPEDLAAIEKALDENGILGKQAYKSLSAQQKQITEKHSIVYLNGLEEFGEQVLNDIWKAIEDRFPDEEMETDPVVIENNYHENYLQQRTRLFTGRQNILKQILTSLQDPEIRKPLFVIGGSGSGKSALLSVVVKTYREQHPTAFTLARFVGASPDSQDIFRLVTDMVRQVENHFGIDHDPERINSHEKLWDYFREVLWKVGGQTPILIVIDAVNQLHSSLEPHYLTWLPKYLPERVKLLVSSIDREYSKKARQLDLPVMFNKPLNKKDICNIISRRLGEYRKKLSMEQMQILLAKKESNKPLYLAVACEELRTYPSFELISQRIADLSDHIPELFSEVLQRLEQDHGRQLVTDALCLTQCSQQGLMEEELLELLAQPGKEKLPANTWARLYRDISLYLSNAGENKKGLIRLFHQQFSDAVKQRYLPDAKTESICYQRLADYGMALFEEKPKVVGNCMKYLGVYLCKIQNKKEAKVIFAETFKSGHNFKIYNVVIEELMGSVVKTEKEKDELFLKDVIASTINKSINKNAADFYGSTAHNLRFSGNNTWSIYFYSLCREILEMLILIEPGIDSFKKDLAMTYGRLGSRMHYKKEVEKANGLFHKQKELLEKLTQKDTDSNELRFCLAESYNNIGQLALISSKFDESLKYFLLEEKQLKSINGKINKQEELMFMRAANLSNFGRLHETIGNYNLALDYYLQGVEIIIKESDFYNERPNLLYAKAIGINNLGRMFEASGDMEKAFIRFSESSSIMKSLHLRLPQRTDIKQNYLTSLFFLGRVCQIRGDKEMAIQLFLEGLKLSEELIIFEPDRNDFRRDYSASLRNVGNYYLMNNQVDSALTYIEMAYEVINKLISENVNNKDLVIRLLFVLFDLHSVHISKGNKKKAEEYLVKAIHFVAKGNKQSNNISFVIIYCTILFSLSQYSKSQDSLNLLTEAKHILQPYLIHLNVNKSINELWLNINTALSNEDK